MTALREIYYCKHCKNLVGITSEGGGKLICCGEDMEKLEAKTEDSSTEKHVPFIEESSNGILVKVGQNTAHPMEEKHYIKFIEVLTKDKILRTELKPGDKPEAAFSVPAADVVEAREWCTLHSLWKA